MQAVDRAIQNGVVLDGTPTHTKMNSLNNRIMDEDNKR